MWWGNGISSLLADRLSDHCFERQICAHRIRRLVNAGVIEIHPERDKAIAFPSPALHWFEAGVFAIVSWALFKLSIIAVQQSSADSTDSILAAVCLAMSGVVVAMMGLSGPVWRLAVRRELLPLGELRFQSQQPAGEVIKFHQPNRL
jgi:hypothetical protein